jgi:hypothetical protein
MLSSPEQKVDLHRTCVRVLDKSASPMQNTFDVGFRKISESLVEESIRPQKSAERS